MIKFLLIDFFFGLNLPVFGHVCEKKIAIKWSNLTTLGI